jgi:hypothetical protein
MVDRAPAPISSAAQTAEDAKADILDWSAKADEEILAHIHELVGTATARARRAAPWAAAAAIVGGLLMGRRRRRRRRERAMGEEPSRGIPIAAILGVAIKLAPVILPLLRARRR